MNYVLLGNGFDIHHELPTRYIDVLNFLGFWMENIVKQWDATLDKRTRDSHAQVDGEIRELDEKFSNGLMYPGDPNGRPEEVINCRCALLQRARWALGNDFTKAVKGADGDELAIIEADKYDDFKKEFRSKLKEAENSQRVRSSAQKIKGKVIDLPEYTVNGTTYKVDGKHVVLDNTENEKRVAKLISDEFKKDVSMVPRVVFPQGVSTPDYIIDGKKYDLKEPTGNGKHVLYNMVHKKKSQANNFIFDISNCPLDYDAIKEQVEEIHSSSHTSFVNEVIIIKDGKIVGKFDRKQ